MVFGQLSGRSNARLFRVFAGLRRSARGAVTRGIFTPADEPVNCSLQTSLVFLQGVWPKIARTLVGKSLGEFIEVQLSHIRTFAVTKDFKDP
jgi:hypothetical protein